jgi:Sulfotransferase domain
MLSDPPRSLGTLSADAAPPGVSASHLIIGGAEKAGTTALHGYLAAHPDVRASIRKETDYFRRPDASAEGYEACFPPPAPDRPSALRAESSPGYLAEAPEVAPRMAAAVPGAHLVFVLRDPVDRLRSAYRFYQSRLHVPESMDFDAFVRACLGHDAGTPTADGAALKTWHLGAAARGRYEDLLPPFDARYPAAQVLLVSFEDLKRDAPGVTRRIARFAGLDERFYDGYSFGRENVSFRARHGNLQRVAIAVNNHLEGFWRQNPAIKRTLLRWYKRFNEQPLQADPLQPGTQARLDDYYAATRAFMAGRLRSG